MLWNSFNIPAIYQSNFHPTAFCFIGKNKGETYMTLIRRLHSLGRGEGRVGLRSNSKCMHWRQDKMASEAHGNESHARRAEQPLGLSRKVWRVGWEAPPSTPRWPHGSYFTPVHGGLLPETRKKKRSKEKPERQRHPERKRQEGEAGVVEARGGTLMEGNIKWHP